jgi:hypothetical protein
MIWSDSLETEQMGEKTKQAIAKAIAAERKAIALDLYNAGWEEAADYVIQRRGLVVYAEAHK